MTTFRYATIQILVHWVATLAIFFLLITGTFILSEMPNTVEKIGNLRIHMLVGGVVGLLVLARIWMRKSKAAPPPMPGYQLARVVQVSLNIGLLVLVASGTVLAIQSGTFDAVFGTGTLPADYMDYLPRKVHGIASKVVMALIALHVAGALYHQFIAKDGLLARMGVGRGRISTIKR